ncbi:hypothetical protein F4780DRAFT_506155 [Xylariomycetidae sp. FL0641]|nr:hypothetical protein F4780DRAFT_506155 [Xylariomycetidae sp. FL0641]
MTASYGCLAIIGSVLSAVTQIHFGVFPITVGQRDTCGIIIRTNPIPSSRCPDYGTSTQSIAPAVPVLDLLLSKKDKTAQVLEIYGAHTLICLITAVLEAPAFISHEMALKHLSVPGLKGYL